MRKPLTRADDRRRHFVDGSADGETAIVRGDPDTRIPPEDLFRLIVDATPPGAECVIFYRKEAK